MNNTNETGETLKYCKGCSCNLLLTFYKKNRKGDYNKSCINCLERAKIKREKNKLKNKDKFKCEKCDYKFYDISSLKRHIKSIHDKVKDFFCENCDYKCSLNGNLQLHIKKVHLKIKDFFCENCDFKCSTSSHLKRHIKNVHNKIKGFGCEKCEVKFFSNSHLKRHIKSIHTKIKDFKCSKCDYICSDITNLNRHIKSIHDKIKNFLCKKCDYKCSASSHLKRHNERVHLKIKKFECEDCNYKCYSNSYFKKHIKNCTGKMNCSSGEFKIMGILNKLNIKYEYNTTYKVKNINFLRWDFIIKLNNKKAFIEYDGRQHFKSVCFGNMNDKKALECYNKCVFRDNLKNEFCEENNFKLLRISYLEKEECEKLIQDFINSQIS